MSQGLTLSVDKSTDTVMARTNLVYVSKQSFDAIPGNDKLVRIKSYLFCAEATPSISDDKIKLNSVQRMFLGLEMNQKVGVSFVHGETPFASSVTMEMAFISQAKNKKLTLDGDKLRAAWKQEFSKVPFNKYQKYVFNYEGEQYTLQVADMECCTLDDKGEAVKIDKAVSGVFAPSITHIMFKKAPGCLLVIEDDLDSGNATNSFFQPDFNFEQLEIGGLDSEMQTLFRRAFNSRLYPPKIIRERGIKHVKGILLYGPPGTGKTLMARQIGKMLKTVEPKVVNGPEIFDKFVGGSEKNIRDLFEDARKDQEENGDNAQLHLIIFDEFDSICKKRGSVSNGTGVSDTVVNQLLSMIDGVDALDDVLLIGMTNRKDLIDDAIMRPGRLEVQIPIGLPNKDGRVQIFNIHTKKLKACGGLAPNVNIEELAEMTPNYTGAEIEGVVKAAQSYALQNGIDPVTMKPKQNADLRVTQEMFKLAIGEVRPAFGVEENLAERFIPRGIVQYSDMFIAQQEAMKRFLSELESDATTDLMCFCISGPPGTGLTSFAVANASQRFDYVKTVTAKQFIGKTEDGVCSEIREIFENAYRSRESAIVIDDIDAIIEFSPIGPRFSNKILQACLVLMKTRPPAGHRLAVFVTTCSRSNMEVIGMNNRYFYKEIFLGPLVDIDQIAKVAKEACQLELNLSESDLKQAHDFFNMSGHAVPVKRAIEALDVVRHEAKGEPISWKALEFEFLQHLDPHAGH